MTTTLRFYTVTLAFFLVSLFPRAVHAQSDCDTSKPETFTVHLPLVGYPPDEEGQGWDRPKVWDGYPDAKADSVTIPNGRPIYALIISGYSSNKNLDQLMVYNFARYLQQKGAYVHWSWWNNLLAPYMERPLHHPQSEPGKINEHLPDFVNMTAEEAGRKAVPSEDYQLVADAKLLLSAIREHNPGAIIVVVGHSMGGGATVHIGSHTNVTIDLLAPIDPVGNRNYPFAGNDRVATSDFNWTRWRITRDNFLGYKKSDWDPDAHECVPTGEWLDRAPLVGSSDIRCLARMFVDDAPTLVFGSNIINLFYRYQQEFLFPFDYNDAYNFGHIEPPNGLTSQAAVPMIHEFCGLSRCSDPGGWPAGGDPDEACCTTGDGVGWPADGHGEIIGYRGPLPEPVPLGVRVRTSPQCGSSCDNLTWPYRYKDDDTWVNGNGALRRQLLMDLEKLPAGTAWANRPINPSLCLVSPGLIDMFDRMNKPPDADAGDDQVVECTGRNGTEVTLDGTASTDPDGDSLTYDWQWAGGSATGAEPVVILPLGRYCMTLTVTDPSGHIDRDVVIVEVVDTTPPELTVELSPASLWPPNHKMTDIQATVRAEDLCGEVASLTLVSVTSDEPDNGRGDGNTMGDIAGVELNTLDTLFQFRSERQGMNGKRTYTVTYQATDESGNRAEESAVVVVENLPPGPPQGVTVQYGTGTGNRLSWFSSRETDFETFAVYRGAEPLFTPEANNQVYRTQSTSWTDPAHDGRDVYYSVSVIDQTGLEGSAMPASVPGLGIVKRHYDELSSRDPETGDQPAGEVSDREGSTGDQERTTRFDPNYPNPFNPSTRISFRLPGEALVSLTVYNILGAEVAKLAETDVMEAGDHVIEWDAGRAPAGVYFYRLQVTLRNEGGRSLNRTGRMLLVK